MPLLIAPGMRADFASLENLTRPDVAIYQAGKERYAQRVLSASGSYVRTRGLASGKENYIRARRLREYVVGFIHTYEVSAHFPNGERRSRRIQAVSRAAALQEMLGGSLARSSDGLESIHVYEVEDA